MHGSASSPVGRPRSAPAALALSLLAALAAAPAGAAERPRVELEGAAAWQTRNDFSVPGNTGTRVRLERASPVASGRVTLVAPLGPRWAVRALAAPLATRTGFVPAAAVRFQDATFAAGAPVELHYVFDSYRVSFLRRWPVGERHELRAGLTGKIRAAKLVMRSPTLEREETNIGFVPLLHGAMTLGFGAGVGFDLDVDALGAPQGYAVDAAARVTRSLGERARLFAGYRVLDGGADVDRVYSFATFHYAIAGLGLRL